MVGMTRGKRWRGCRRGRSESGVKESEKLRAVEELSN
jgi:hypothetical protein